MLYCVKSTVNNIPMGKRSGHFKSLDNLASIYGVTMPVVYIYVRATCEQFMNKDYADNEQLNLKYQISNTNL